MSQPSFPSCDLELVVCFVGPAVLINRTVFVAWLLLWSGLNFKVKVHFPPQPNDLRETPSSSGAPFPPIFQVMSSGP